MHIYVYKHIYVYTFYLYRIFLDELSFRRSWTNCRLEGLGRIVTWTNYRLEKFSLGWIVFGRVVVTSSTLVLMRFLGLCLRSWCETMGLFQTGMGRGNLDGCAMVRSFQFRLRYIMCMKGLQLLVNVQWIDYGRLRGCVNFVRSRDRASVCLVCMDVECVSWCWSFWNLFDGKFYVVANLVSMNALLKKVMAPHCFELNKLIVRELLGGFTF